MWKITPKCIRTQRRRRRNVSRDQTVETGEPNLLSTLKHLGKRTKIQFLKHCAKCSYLGGGSTILTTTAYPASIKKFSKLSLIASPILVLLLCKIKGTNKATVHNGSKRLFTRNIALFSVLEDGRFLRAIFSAPLSSQRCFHNPLLFSSFLFRSGL